MRNAHIRILVLLAIATLVGIIITQMHWLNRAIDQQDQVFNHNVHVALRNVVESLCEANGKDYPTVNPIERLSSNYYIVRTNDQIDIKNLEYLISAEIRRRDITQAFDYGVYDCQNDQMVFAENIEIDSDRTQANIPDLENTEYYFGIYFPDKSESIIAGLDLWKFTTVLTIVVLFFFGYALFVILKQKKLSEIQKDFINNVTHELKTPLSTLALASNSLLKQDGNSSNRYLQIVQNEVTRLKSNVERILQASLSEEHLKVTKEALDINQFLNELLSQFEEHYRSQMIKWKLVGDAKKSVWTNKSVLEKVIRNLFENAVKYGGRTIEVEVSQVSRETIIRIADDGNGISKEHLKKIFDKFFRVPDPQDQHNAQGFGLGLYIVKSSLKTINGKISVTSSIGKGSTFTIKLPNG